MIIGLVGLIGSGKGTVGDILADNYGFQKQQFAGSLKDATSAIFDWPRHLLEGDTSESREWRERKDEYWSKALNRDITPRLALQLMGTEAGRNVFGDKLWTTSVKAKIDNDHVNLDHVITDVRFPNEIEAIREWGGKVYRIRRGREPEWFRVAEIENNHPKSVNVKIGKTMEKFYPEVHISEWAWIGHEFDGVIENNGSKTDLREKVELMLIKQLPPAV